MMEGRTSVNRVATLMIGGGLLLAAGGTSEASVVCGGLPVGTPTVITCTQAVTSSTFSQNNIPTGTLNSASAMTVAQWNANPGVLVPLLPTGYTWGAATLQSVEATLFASTSGSVSITRGATDGANNPRDYTARITKNFVVDLDPSVGGTLSLPVNNVQPATQTVTLDRGQSGSATFANQQLSGSLTSVAPSILSQYTGAGSLTLALQILQQGITIPGGGGNPAVAYTDLSAAYVEMLYTFTLTATPVNNVPEPMSLALFGLGLLGLAAAGRRAAG